MLILIYRASLLLSGLSNNAFAGLAAELHMYLASTYLILFGEVYGLDEEVWKKRAYWQLKNKLL